jgi:hypothetical protein
MYCMGTHPVQTGRWARNLYFVATHHFLLAVRTSLLPLRTQGYEMSEVTRDVSRYYGNEVSSIKQSQGQGISSACEMCSLDT